MLSFGCLCWKIDDTNLEISREVKILFDNIFRYYLNFRSKLSASFSDEERRTVMDALGQAGSDYRWNIYQQGFSGKFESLSVSKLKSFLELTCQYIEHSLKANQRADGLYHAYNILNLGQNTAEIDYLDEMLEGQVSILSSGLLSPKEALTFCGICVRVPCIAPTNTAIFSILTGIYLLL